MVSYWRAQGLQIKNATDLLVSYPSRTEPEDLAVLILVLLVVEADEIVRDRAEARPDILDGLGEVADVRCDLRSEFGGRQSPLNGLFYGLLPESDLGPRPVRGDDCNGRLLLGETHGGDEGRHCGSTGSSQTGTGKNGCSFAPVLRARGAASIAAIAPAEDGADEAQGVPEHPRHNGDLLRLPGHRTRQT